MEKVLEAQIAGSLLESFDAFYSRFLEVTRGAKLRFENADWHGVQIAAKKRISLYDYHVGKTAQKMQDLAAEAEADQVFLQGIKREYEALLQHYPNFEIAESFFNSVYRRVFKHTNIYKEQLFITNANRVRDPGYPNNFYRSYTRGGNFSVILRKIIGGYTFTARWENLDRDLANVVDYLNQHAPKQLTEAEHIEVHMLNEVFYRNKGAYLMGKIFADGHMYPLVFPILNNEENEIYLDTVIFEKEETSILFGFARAYFFVYAPEPGAIVQFLKPMIPHKTNFEIYSAIGCQKHAKTELFRHYIKHLDNSDDKFIIAPGIKGMVMSVFTLPSYDVVFKLIKDKFAPPKQIDHATVKEKYQIVKSHDRVGRMADTQQFKNFAFPKDRFSQELLDELLAVAPSIIKITNSKVVIKHLYIERKMIPLNMYLEQANEEELDNAIDEYGNAIKQLAAADIFPGDMLFKNFGVTRHNRVIFYDYDEISYMHEVNFRYIPPPRYPEDIMLAEPWFAVAPNDVFPEEFETFLLSRPEINKLFKKYHAELLDADYWKGLQDDINHGKYSDVFPYRRARRFIRDE
ncbi:Isocitrate dehydrogenase phosphatase/kinase [Moritella sp. JT01]|uniref:bifunctional isocitrate dehydrogenase kinase/phosphatase n=1 Tax=Moritella sp. JT01 TaxID=756698 RepID=UPI0007957F4A|nr:bifunctional isocitrate dehydrogenase kinase/phosphatase [Moritella sp. JT01]KXO10110.1 Isocitrate dehydrogenase phosphatase/kinase [Moritella sp. JT01]